MASKDEEKRSSQLEKELCKLAAKMVRNHRDRTNYSPKPVSFETEKRVYRKSNHQSDEPVFKKSKGGIILLLN